MPQRRFRSKRPARSTHRAEEFARANRLLEAEVARLRESETEARGHEQFYRTLVETTHDIITVVSPKGTIIYGNPAAQAALGYPPGEPLGRSVFDFVHAEDAPRLRESLRDLARRPGTTVTNDFRFRHADGSWRILRATGRNILENPAIAGVIVNLRDITRRAQAEEAVRIHQEALRALTARLLTAEEEERKRLSRELHDDLNQRIAILAMEVDALARDLPSSPEQVQRQLRSLQDRLAGLSEDLRRVAYQLRPSILDDLGLPAALRVLCDDFAGEKLEVQFASRGVPGRLPPDAALCLYRVAQEALHNVARHADARHVRINLTRTAGALLLTIRDDGRGFDRRQVRGKGGLGIVGMEERVRLVGGLLSIRSRPGWGAVISVRIPLGGQQK